MDAQDAEAVLVDGSGETHAEGFEPWISAFTSWGFAVLSYDKRRVGDSGGRYVGGYDIDVPWLGRDAAAEVEYLTSLEEIDETRIGLLGTSQAGVGHSRGSARIGRRVIHRHLLGNMI